MFELDEKFFEEIGVNRMPKEEAEAFKQHARDELESRVGERIIDGFSTEKIDEFEKLVEDVPGEVERWIAQNSPDFRNDEVYQKLLNYNNGQETRQTLVEYASMKWLQVNRPDFPQILAIVTDELQKELRANIDKIFE